MALAEKVQDVLKEQKGLNLSRDSRNVMVKAEEDYDFRFRIAKDPLYDRFMVVVSIKGDSRTFAEIRRNKIVVFFDPSLEVESEEFKNVKNKIKKVIVQRMKEYDDTSKKKKVKPYGDPAFCYPRKR